MIITFSFVILNSLQAQQLKINEFGAKNASSISDKFGEFEDWIELYNSGNNSIDLNGYYISDDIYLKTKYKLSGTGLTISAGGHLILWADKDFTQGTDHIGFKLSGDAGIIILSDPQVNILDSVSYKTQCTDVSFGRNPFDLSVWMYYPTPTPGKINNTPAYKGISQSPVFSHVSGSSNVPFQLNLSSPVKTDTIRYTLNSKSPTKLDPAYVTPINISKTTVVRARASQYGWYNSDISSQIYFYNATHALPVLAIITDSLNLFDAVTGIYTHPKEDGPSWEKFCQIKFLENGILQTESNAGIRIQGSSSVTMSKKSFRLFFRDEYGKDHISYPFFGTNNIGKFKKLVLKPGYDDDITFESNKTGTLLRDALSIELYKRIGGMPQQSRWASLYLNNQYWGIYDIRESIDEHFIEDHTGYKNFDLIRFVNDSSELKYGTKIKWNDMYSFVTNSDFTNDQNFTQIEKQIDMNEFISLLSFVQCTQYYSWCWGVSMFCKDTINEKWHFSIWDTDRAYTNEDWNGFIEAESNSSNYWANRFPRRFMKNSEFNRRYVNRICDLYNSTFYPDNAITVLDSIYNIIKPEMAKELSRWNPSNNDWEANVEAVRNFLRNRPEILKQQIRERFALSNTNNISLNVSGNGHIKINLLNVRSYPWSGDYFENNNIDLEAIPDEGYHFTGWSGYSESNSPRITVNPTDGANYIATFELGTYVNQFAINNLKISIFPNPANENATISFNLPENSKVRIVLYSIDGKEQLEVGNTLFNKGFHAIKIKLESLTKGVYIISLKSGKFNGHQYVFITK